MGLGFLAGASWTEVTRDEPFFCAHLFRIIEQNGVADFVDFINPTVKVDLDPSANWEIGFETCFYRDFWQFKKKQCKLYSPKRTFDLQVKEHHIHVRYCSTQSWIDRKSHFPHK